MKKFFALLAIVFSLVLLSACSGEVTAWEDDLRFYSDKQDAESAYYSALNVDIVSYSTEEGTSYEIQIGLRDLPEYNLFSDAFIEALRASISSATGKDFGYIGRHNVSDSTHFYNTGSNARNYTYYSFLTTERDYSLSSVGTEYSFFHVKQELILNLPQWLIGFEQKVYRIVNSLVSTIEGHYTIDTDSMYLRYYLVIDEALTTQNATHVYKTVVSLEQTAYKSIMWQATNTSAFNGIPLEYSAMAPGWYIIPIIMGTLCVVILLLVCKYHKPMDDIFRKDEAFVAKDRDAVLDGQISMDDLERNVDDSEEKNG